MKFTNLEKAVTWAVKNMSESRGWITEDYLDVFSQFFKAYRHFTGGEHPDISYFAMLQLMERMPWADTGEKVPLEPSEYTGLIGAYFCDSGPERDHNIHRFFSGEIRIELDLERRKETL